MKVSRAKDQRCDEEEADPRVEGKANGPPHECLAECAADGQDIANKVELGNL